MQPHVEGDNQVLTYDDKLDIPLVDSIISDKRTDKQIKQSGVEVLSERTINSKTFKGPGNKKTVRYSNQPEHYFSNGEWKEINTNFKRKITSDSIGVMDENNYTVEIMKDYPGVRIKKDSYSIKYEPTNIETGSRVKIVENTVSYSELWKYTDLIYSVTKNSTKMYIVINDPKAQNEFNFNIKTQGLEAVQNKDQSVSFFDVNGIKKFEIPPMWVKGTNSEIKHFEKIGIDLTKSKDGYNLKIKLDDSGLQYPLVIDPSTVSFFATDVDSNKIYIDTYEMYTDEIEKIVFTNDALDPSRSYGVNYPMNVYFVHQDVETNGETIPYGYYGCCSPEPGVDGISATRVGKTDVYSGINELVLNSEEISNLFGNRKIVSGVAFWVPELEADYEMYNHAYITYNPSMVSPPQITKTGYDNGKLFWEYSDRDGKNTQTKYRIEIFDIFGKNIKDTGFVNSKSTYYLISDKLVDGIYSWRLTLEDDTGEMDFKNSEFLIGIDTISPTIPEDLKVIKKTNSSVTLSWEASTDNLGVASYSILLNGTLVETLSSRMLEYTLRNPSEGYVHTITVQANDYARNYSSAQIKIPFGKLAYKYDAQNRLDYIEFQSTGNIYIDYSYDLNGNQIKKVVNN
ncbi:Ig-like domain-containing protein [Cytobacillus firmus]|nr:Ig-like domain-containing protein [Cytobacillus firmus]